MIRRLLYRLSARLPCRIISDGGQPYLERYFLFSAFGLQGYLHRFVASDPDRGLHDHPWPWAVSLLLAGSYTELTRSGAHPVRWLNTLVGDTFHRVLLPKRLRLLDVSELRMLVEDGEQECWTLFIHRARNVKPWGFFHAVGNLPVAEAFVWARYPSDVNERQWWRAAPKGRDCIRQAEYPR